METTRVYLQSLKNCRSLLESQLLGMSCFQTKEEGKSHNEAVYDAMEAVDNLIEEVENSGKVIVR